MSNIWGFVIVIILALIALWYFGIFDVTQPIRDLVSPYWTSFKASLKGDQGPPGASITGPPGKDADINTIKGNLVWCDNTYCKAPPGKQNFEVGQHRLKFDNDKVLRHHNLSDNHNAVGIATGTIWSTENAFLANANIAGKLVIGNHELVSVGNELRVGYRGAKHVALYSDTMHSSIKTQRGNGTDNWFGY
jgi:hypothetical protein